MEEEDLRRDLEDEIRILQEQRDERIYELFEGRKLTKDLRRRQRGRSQEGRRRSTARCSTTSSRSCFAKAEVSAGSIDIAGEVKEYEQRTERQINILRDIYDEKITKLKQGDELPPGVIKMVKVFVAMKRKLSRRRQDGRPSR